MMKKYFILRTDGMDVDTSPEQILLYRDKVIEALKQFGATSQEIALLHDETILNSIRNNRKPEDIAWAILQ